MTSHLFSLADTRILGTLGRYAIEAAKHEVDLRDGSLHAFHHVRDAADPSPRSRHLRALRLPDDHWYIVDLRDLAPPLGAELGPCPERDRPGLVKFTLRPLYPRGTDLRAKVRAAWKACGAADQQLQARAA